MKRYELTDEQRKECISIYTHLMSLGVEPGTPERGVKWWNWDKYETYVGETRNAITHEVIEPAHFVKQTPDMIGMSSRAWHLKFWEAIMWGLYDHGYPCTLKHAIKYYVLSPDRPVIDEDITEEKRNARILYNLYKHPEYV